MTISTLLMILAFAVGPGTGQSIETTYSPCPIGVTRCKIANNCYVNGILVNPCPSENPDPSPDPSPEIQT